MDIKQALLSDYSKANTVRIANYIGDDPVLFATVVDYFLGTEWWLGQRAAWVVSHCADKYPTLIIPYLEQVILSLEGDLEVAVKRNALRVLQGIEVPEELMGRLTNICFDNLNSSTAAIAIKIYSMTILANICKQEPDLKQELYLVIEGQMPYGSAGFKARGRKILKQLMSDKNT